MDQAIKEAFFNELTKIAAVKKPKFSLGNNETFTNKDKFKRWAKNTALVMGGTGLGLATAMTVDRLVSKKIGPLWGQVNPEVKAKVIGVLIGLTTAGSYTATKRLAELRGKKDNE